MEVLANATKVNINNSHFSNVGRNQYNNCTFHRPIAWSPEKRNKNLNLPQLSEFTEVKRGNIYKDSSGVCYSWRLCSNGKDNTEAAVYHAELNIAGPFGQKNFTVKTYRGRNAMKEWSRDFLRCSGDWCRDISLFGYSASSVPLLIFCGELIPIAHIRSKAGMPVTMMRLYFDLLRKTLGCFMNEIWMNPMIGRFCRGPAGPKFRDWLGDSGNITIPADVDFLKEGVLIRYLSSVKGDRSLLRALNHSSPHKRAKNIRSNHSQVTLSFHNSTIAFKRYVKWGISKGFIKKKMTRHGLTRFCLKDDQRHLEVYSTDASHPWLAQALSVFHTHGIRLDEEDLSFYKLVYADFDLKGTFKKSKQQRRQLCKPIYFFLEPCPSPDRRLYFWSHDPTGRNPLSPDMCKYLGLPFKLSLKAAYKQKAWPTKIYKALYNYQISRGFDPQTTDFAQFMRYPIWEVVPPENRLQELDEDENNLPSGSRQLLPELDNAPQHPEGVMMDEVRPERPEESECYSFDMLFYETQDKGSDHVLKGNDLVADPSAFL
ncbi:hypothetical protein L218DRAFT_1001577 [Marasmius fiardii PR-910]|nr:hypothetical protein L218DRAFT_1001577 [Marasmius fiardii PR-910]